MAYGCNIGAYFSGIISGSLHAWLWVPAAFAGNALGVYFRPFFGLSVEKHLISQVANDAYFLAPILCLLAVCCIKCDCTSHDPHGYAG